MNACANCKINKTCPNANESDGFEVCEGWEGRHIGGSKMTIQDILEELRDSVIDCGLQNSDCTCFTEAIAQAKIKIEEMFREWVGEDKDFGNTFINKYILDKYKPKDIYNAGYNKRGEEIRNRVKEWK